MSNRKATWSELREPKSTLSWTAGTLRAGDTHSDWQEGVKETRPLAIMVRRMHQTWELICKERATARDNENTVIDDRSSTGSEIAYAKPQRRNCHTTAAKLCTHRRRRDAASPGRKQTNLRSRTPSSGERESFTTHSTSRKKPRDLTTEQLERGERDPE